MSATPSLAPAAARPRAPWALPAILLFSAMANGYHLWWGLPNGNTSWAADAITPLTPLAVAHASFTQGWNSGWFYFKYPIGHPLLLLLGYLPYLGALWLAGGFAQPSAVYPHGFADAESALRMLALLGRGVSVAMGTATVWLVYRIGQRLFGRGAALCGALGAAAGAALIFYSHTTNLDVPCLFWMALAAHAAVTLIDTSRARALVVFGAACGMALATKEQVFGLLVGLALVVGIGQLVRWRRGQVRGAPLAGRLAVGAASGALVLLLASNAVYNPLGFYHRLQFLTGTLPAEAHAQWVPRAAYISVGTMPDLEAHRRTLREAGRLVGWSMGVPWLTLSLGGVLVAAGRNPWRVAGVLVPLGSYYLLSLAALPLVTVRYVLPIAVALALFGGVMARALWRLGAAGKTVVLAVLACTVAQGVGVDYLLAHDPRYQAEAWLQQHGRPGMTLETYHRATFLPRFPSWLTVTRPQFREISRAHLARRAPDLILISLADVRRITGRYDRVAPHVVTRPENEAFVRALFDGELGYRPAARFQARWPLLSDGPVRSLNPPLVLFVRG